MINYFDLSAKEREVLLAQLREEYNGYCARSLSLDLSRGKPNASQLDVSMGLMSVSLSDDYRANNGFDCRN